MTIDWGSALSKTHFDADTDDPSQARAELEAMVDRINTKLANQTLLQLSDKTGNDSGIVSGTAGTDGNLVQWNADGDVVDGPDVLDEDDMASDSASAVPTQQSVRAYTDAGDPTLASEVDATNGGSNDLNEISFTGIKSGAHRIVVMLDRVSLNGSDDFLIQIGDSGGFETSGYTSNSVVVSDSSQNVISNSSGFVSRAAESGNIFSVIFTLTRIDTANTWLCTHNGRRANTSVHNGAGDKTLSSELDRLKVTTTGTNNFDSGDINILVE